MLHGDGALVDYEYLSYTILNNSQAAGITEKIICTPDTVTDFKGWKRHLKVINLTVVQNLTISHINE